MRVIKRADADNVIPFPARAQAASWKDVRCTATLPCARCREIQKRRAIRRWVAIYVGLALAAVGLTWLCWWMAGR